MANDGTRGEHDPVPVTRGHWVLWVTGGAIVVFALVAIASLVVSSIRPAQADASDSVHLSAPEVKVLQFDALDGDPVHAPDFALTDQNGERISPSSFRGKVIVLTVADDRCEDLCTLFGQDILAADRDLGAAADDVVFISVNANPYYPAVSDVHDWTVEHGLADQSNWHFVTGQAAQLHKVWRSYAVPVELDPHTRTVEHGTQIYFIGPHGFERAMGAFGTSAASTTAFGHALARAAAEMMPPHRRPAVSGSTPIPTGSTDSDLGAAPTPFSLPSLGGSGTVGIAASHGEYTVLSFWSSTCTACIRELPAIEESFRAAGKKTAFVGIDVADDPTKARSLATELGLDYPIGSDPSGTAAAQFAVSALPYTVIIDPDGDVTVRHPGAFTAEQLEYLLQTFEANPE